MLITRVIKYIKRLMTNTELNAFNIKAQSLLDEIEDYDGGELREQYASLQDSLPSVIRRVEQIIEKTSEVKKFNDYNQ